MMAAPEIRGSGGSTAPILAVLSAAAAMATLDLFIVNVAFPDISNAFSAASFANVSWVLNGYTVVYAAMLVPLGRLADRYSRRAGFAAGVAVFTAASAACAAAPNLWALVLFRGLQAVGAAALTPTSLGLLLAATPAVKRPGAVRTWAAIGAVAATAGPVIGGLLVQASWRWIFIVNIPVGAAVLLLTRRLVPDSRDPSVTEIPDLLGAALLATGIGALALGLVKAPAWGWTSAATLSSYGIAAVSAVFFTFALSGPLPPKEMGITLGIAVLLDAALVRLLLPVLLRLTGRAAWWSPAWLRRVLPAVKFAHD